MNDQCPFLSLVNNVTGSRQHAKNHSRLTVKVSRVCETKCVKINKQQGHLKVSTTVISLKNDAHNLSRHAPQLYLSRIIPIICPGMHHSDISQE